MEIDAFTLTLDMGWLQSLYVWPVEVMHVNINRVLGKQAARRFSGATTSV